MKQANPADYIEKARSTPGAEYEGDWIPRARNHPGWLFLIRVARHLRYPRDVAIWFLLTDKFKEIEREIEEVKLCIYAN